jgi:hypothetical protein
MTDNYSQVKLIGELLADPENFNSSGKAYQLLQRYFRGSPVDTLRPLLIHRNAFVRRAAIFVVSELGSVASELLNEVVPLIRDPDPYIRCYSLESVMVCSCGQHVGAFVNVVRELESHDDWMRLLAMRLTSNATLSQLEAGSKLSDLLGRSSALHREGLSVLVDGDSVHEPNVMRMIEAQFSLTRKYAAIAAKRLLSTRPWMLEAAISSPDPDVSRFSIEATRERNKAADDD